MKPARILTRPVSMVQSATRTATKPVLVSRAIEAIKGGRWRKQIERIRATYKRVLAIEQSSDKAKKSIESLKKKLPAMTWSGTFSKRESEALVSHSGLQCADLDLLGSQLTQVRAKLIQSQHLVACFISPSGDGLKAIFRVRPDANCHRDSFRAVEQYVRELTGVSIDHKGKDEARLCFVSYDPDLFVNEKAVAIQPLAPPPEPKPKREAPANIVDLPLRERIAAELLGTLTWSAEKAGYFCECPGKANHTSGTGAKDTIIYLDNVPTLNCQHESCLKIVEAFNAQLRSRIGKIEKAQTPLHKAKAQPSDKSENENANADDEVIARLAAMPQLEYERVRKDEAKKLGCRPSILDSLVRGTRLLNRAQGETDDLQGVAVKLEDVEPWPELVNGADILDAIAQRFLHYVVLPEGAGNTLALWCAHTHMFKQFQKSPRLHISAPTEECGKTTLRNCTSLFCARGKCTDNMTTAVMFRLVSGHFPTILADECDKWLFINEELVGLVQSGHEKGGAVMRCEGDSNELREFGCYAPFALAAIGKLPSQLHSRSICIRLERATGDEIKKRSSFEWEHVEYETELNRKLARWITDNRERIQICNPKLPEHLFNRIADNWRPLFKIAEVAGGDWPRRCNGALVKLTTREDERENLRVMLLADIREVFKTERMFSKDLVERLIELKDRPWPEICHGKPVTQRWLARNLVAFGIHSGNIWDGENQAQAKGYERAQFKNVFARYIPENPQEGGGPSVQPSNTMEKAEKSSVQEDELWTDEKRPIYEAIGRLDACPPGEAPKKGKI